MYNKRNKILSLFIAFAMVLGITTTSLFIDNKAYAEETNAESSEQYTVDDGINVLVDYFNKKYYVKNNGQLTDWQYVAMVKAGADLDKVNWKKKDARIPKSATYDSLTTMAGKAKQSMILLELGMDPTNFENRNLIDEIVTELNNTTTSRFIINELHAMVAVDRFNEAFPEKEVEYKKELIDLVISQQGGDGAIDKAVPNTAYALEIFTRHEDLDGVLDAKEKALNYLKGVVKDDGAIYDKYLFTTIHSEALREIIKSGRNLYDDGFIDDNRDVISGIFSLWDGKTFQKRNNGGEDDYLAYMQSLYTLAELKEAGYGDYVLKGVKFDNYKKEEPEKICKANIAIVYPKDDKSLELKLKPQEVSVSSKKHSGLTVLGALQAATDEFILSGNMVKSIFGIENEGMNGWIYTVNGEMPSTYAGETIIKDGDKIVWYYSKDGMWTNIPTWEDLADYIEPKDYTDEVASSIQTVSNIILQGDIGDWEAASLAALGTDIPENYIKSITEKIQNRDESLFKDGKFKNITDLERTIIGIVAAGKDPRNIGNYDLIQDLCSRDLLKENNIFAQFYGLVALDSGKFKLTKDCKFTRQDIINKIISMEEKDGGWGWGSMDVDTTAMVVMALSNYTEDQRIKNSVDKAVDALSKAQNGNGGYTSPWDNSESSESISQTIVALCSLGIDPASSKFTKNQKNLMDALFSFKTEDGGFAHSKADLKKADAMATEQALRALAAYKRFKDGKTGSIYLFKEFKDDDSKDIQIKNLTNIERFEIGTEAKITIEAVNNSNEEKEATLIIGLFNKDGKLVNYVAAKQNIKMGNSSELTGCIKLPNEGEYTVRAFVWDNLENMNILSDIIEIPVK